MIELERVVGLAFVQDGGRPGRLREGVPRGGALIPSAPSDRPTPVRWRNASIRARTSPLSCRAYVRSRRTVTSAIDETR